jgi:ATP-binding cassette subfamily B protein
VEQEPFLFSRTIRENIRYGANKEVTKERLKMPLNCCDPYVIMDFPDGYNTLVGERGVTLSGGQKQTDRDCQ